MSMVKKLMLLVLFLVPSIMMAQNSVSGKVYDFENKRLPISGAYVRNLSNKQSTKTLSGGSFSIAAKIGDLLEFSYVGYHTDTVYLINLSPRAIYLPARSTDLKEVSIKGAKINSSILSPDPEAKEFKRFESDALKGKGNNDRAGGLKFNLGYGKYKRQQEQIKKMEERDFYESEISNVFNEKYVSDLVKLKGQELKDFMSLYRPSALLVQTERPFNYAYYIVKAYHTWLKLPPAQRRPSSVPKLKNN